MTCFQVTRHIYYYDLYWELLQDIGRHRFFVSQLFAGASFCFEAKLRATFEIAFEVYI